MVVFGSLGVLVLLIGMVGVWAINAPVTDLATSAMGTLLGPLEQAQSGLQQVDGVLVQAQSSVGELQTTVKTLGASMQADSLVLKKLGDLVGTDLKGSVDKALDGLTRLKATLDKVQGVIQGLDRLPFVDLPSWTQELSDAIDGVEQTATTIRETSEALEAMRVGAIGQAVESVTEKSNQIQSRLTTVQGRVQTAENKVDSLVSTLRSLQQTLPRTIDGLSALLSALLIWMAVGQWLLLSIGWSRLKTGRSIPFYPLRKGEAGAPA
jgi:uncharacterized phage infection (PIP) family protein YhgE